MLTCKRLDLASLMSGRVLPLPPLSRLPHSFLFHLHTRSAWRRKYRISQMVREREKEGEKERERERGRGTERERDREREGERERKKEKMAKTHPG